MVAGPLSSGDTRPIILCAESTIRSPIAGFAATSISARRQDEDSTLSEILGDRFPHNAPCWQHLVFQAKIWQDEPKPFGQTLVLSTSPLRNPPRCEMRSRHLCDLQERPGQLLCEELGRRGNRRCFIKQCRPARTTGIQTMKFLTPRCMSPHLRHFHGG
jgi:hypothetical protein